MKRWMRVAVAACVAAACGVPARSEEAREELDPGRWNISTDGEVYTLWANEVYLEDLLLAIQRMSIGEVRVQKAANRKVSVRCFNVTLDQLLSRLGLEYFLFFRREGAGGAYALESGWIGDAAEGRAAPAFPSLGGKALAAGPAPALPPGVRERLGRPEAAKEDLGVRYRAPVPVSVGLDGDVSDWPEGVVWQVVSHEMGVNAPTNDLDASFAVASVSDGTNVYLAVNISDDMRSYTNATGRKPPSLDDAIHLFLDGGGPGSPDDGKPDVNFLINRHHVFTKSADNTYATPSRQYVSQSSGARAAIASREDGWLVEISVPLTAVNAKLAENPALGFNLVLHDVDAGEQNEHALIWSRGARVADLSGSGGQAGLGELQFIDVGP